MMNVGQLEEEEIRNQLLPLSAQIAPDVIGSGYRRAAVLVPIICWDDGWHLLFTRRSDLVNDHKGQVSFPGGALEPLDSSPTQAALREAYEEIGLPPEDVNILGRMPDFSTTSRYVVTPVVGRIQKPFEVRLSPNEVSRAFIVPMHWLADKTNWEEKPYRSSNGEEHQVIFYKLYDGELLWGVTARMTLLFLELIGAV